MNYRNSVLALAIASGLSAAPAAHALDLGEFNGTEAKIDGYFKAKGIYQKDDVVDDSEFINRSNQSRVNLKTVARRDGRTIVGFVECDFDENA